MTFASPSNTICIPRGGGGTEYAIGAQSLVMEEVVVIDVVLFFPLRLRPVP